MSAQHSRPVTDVHVCRDTDDVLLRDLRPLLEFSGEFATKLTMSFYFNNNVLGVRPGSKLSAGLVDIVCRLPYSRDTRKYCAEVKEYCYPKWYWNHGVFQIAQREKLAFVAYPMSFTDPAYGCYPPMLLSASGGAPIRNWNLDEVLELIRGAFVLHTRGYNARKPLPEDSNFGRLYARAKRGAALKDDSPRPLVRVGARNATEQAGYNKIYARLRPTMVEPPFMPAAPWVLLQLKTLKQGAKEESCVYAERSPGTYGHLSQLEISPRCASDSILEADQPLLGKMHERHTWMWHPKTGHIRPAIREPGRIYCLDGELAFGRGSADVPMVNICNPTRESQRWTLTKASSSSGGKGHESVRVQNTKSSKCVEAVMTDTLGDKASRYVSANSKQKVPKQLVPLLRDCNDGGDDDGAQLFEKRQFQHATHGFKWGAK